MKTILPADYNIPATSPEAYVAIAVSDLVRSLGPAALHLGGELSKEYLGMLSLYAIRRAKDMFDGQEHYGGLTKLSYEYFDPSDMSADLVRCLTDIVNEALGGRD